MNFDDFNDPSTDDIPTKPRYGNEQTAAIPDGDYEIELRGGELKEQGGGIFTFLGEVTSAGPFKGWKLEKAVFLNKKDGTDEEKRDFRNRKLAEIKADLKTLGFDVEHWTAANGRPFGAQWKMACSVMAGLQVRVRKATKGNYVNVYFNKRLADKDGRPAKFGADDMVAPPDGVTDGGGEAPAATGAPHEQGDPVPF